MGGLGNSHEIKVYGGIRQEFSQKNPAIYVYQLARTRLSLLPAYGLGTKKIDIKVANRNNDPTNHKNIN